MFDAERDDHRFKASKLQHIFSALELDPTSPGAVRHEHVLQTREKVVADMIHVELIT